MDAQTSPDMPPNMAQMAGPDAPADVPHGTPEEDGGDEAVFLEEAKRGLDGIRTALFKDKKVSDQFLSVIKPDQKVDSLVRAAILLITELDKRLDLDDEVLPAMSALAAGELMELAEAGHGMTFSEQEQKQIVATTFEGILQAYGADPQAAADFVGEVGPEAEQQGIAEYQSMLPTEEGG